MKKIKRVLLIAFFVVVVTGIWVFVMSVGIPLVNSLLATPLSTPPAESEDRWVGTYEWIDNIESILSAAHTEEKALLDTLPVFKCSMSDDCTPPIPPSPDYGYLDFIDDHALWYGGRTEIRLEALKKMQGIAPPSDFPWIHDGSIFWAENYVDYTSTVARLFTESEPVLQILTNPNDNEAFAELGSRHMDLMRKWNNYKERHKAWHSAVTDRDNPSYSDPPQPDW